MSAALQLAGERPQILIFQPPGTPEEETPLTLRRYYERDILPELLEDGIKPASLKEDRTALGHWEA